MGGEGKSLGLGVGGNSKEWSTCDRKTERRLFQERKRLIRSRGSNRRSWPRWKWETKYQSITTNVRKCQN